jgi:hypothetical protein
MNRFLPAVLLVFCWLVATARAEPLLKAGDVVALVGGEEAVAAVETGELELLLTRAFPSHRLKFRSLAWEGDTVYEQPRDLNYPTLVQQLDEIAATVVLMQFGLMESLAGPDHATNFATAYAKLAERLGEGGRRRVILLTPTRVLREAAARFSALPAYSEATRALAARLHFAVVSGDEGVELTPASYRDGIHLSAAGQQAVAANLARKLGAATGPGEATSTDELRLADAIHAKNRFWSHYARPQNWAFLNGDRTVQPSSRDHLDPSKRWFPEEMKQWLPLIAAKEEEIWKLAKQIAPK